MKELKFTNNKNERLDKFLKANYPDFSRSQWQKIIKANQVLVNNKKITVHHKLQAGDKIKINGFPKNDFVELPDLNIKIIHEDKNYLVIEKPAGLPVHPDSKHKTNTLIQQLVKKYPDIKTNLIDHNDLTPMKDPNNLPSLTRGQTLSGKHKADKSTAVSGEQGDIYRPGVVHRLDKDVSGVMVIARTKEMFDFLKQEFQKRNIYKEYLALVHDPISKPEDEIKFLMVRDKKTGKMKIKPANQTGKIAITKYKVIKNFIHFSYVQIVIKTGRTHQIRTLMRALDHPIVGDTLYAKKKVKANLELDRPFLHAHKLKFYNLNKEYLAYESPLPQELQSIIDEIK